MQTQLGQFSQDPIGLWHYRHEQLTGDIDNAIADALAYKPDGVVWFWFNGTPAGICPGDTAEILKERWTKWRRAYQRHNGQFLTCLNGEVKPR